MDSWRCCDDRAKILEDSLQDPVQVGLGCASLRGTITLSFQKFKVFLGFDLPDPGRTFFIFKL